MSLSAWLISTSKNVTTEHIPGGCQLDSWASRRKGSGASSQGSCGPSAAEIQTPTEGLWEGTATDASVTSGNVSAPLCALPAPGTLQQRQQGLRTAKSRISVQSQSHQRTKMIHRSWDADTPPMTFLCRRVRQHQPWCGRTLCSSLQRGEAARAPGQVPEPLDTARVSTGSCEGWRLPHRPAWLPWAQGYSALLLCNQSFFMQLLLQRCPVRSDYYGGWKTLLFLTAGSRLSGLKRIFRSSCFCKAFKSVVTTAKTVCLCFGHCFSMAFVLPCSCKWKVESFFHKHGKLLAALHPGGGTAAF